MSLNLIPATPENLTLLGVGIEHHFGGKAYIKATHIPAGKFLGQHVHDHDHLSVLVSGKVRLWIDAEPGAVIDGYQTLTIPAGKQHGIEALTDAIWLCVWGTECTDPDTVDNHILEG